MSYDAVCNTHYLSTNSLIVVCFDAFWGAFSSKDIDGNIAYPATSTSGATRQMTPRSSEHRPLTGSGGARLMYGGSSRNVIRM